MKAPSGMWRWLQIDAAAVAACLALAGIAYFGGVRPRLRSHGAYSAVQQKLANHRAMADRAEGQRKALAVRLDTVRRALARSTISLETTAHVNRRLARISRMASENGVLVGEVLPGRPKAGTHYQTVPIILTGGADYRSFTLFLRHLRKTLPDMGVTAFELTGNAVQPAADCTYRLTLSWYAAPEIGAPSRR